MQWATKAARANLAPAPDDSHSSLEWNALEQALLCQPLPGDFRVGVRISSLELLFLRGNSIEKIHPLKGDANRGQWLDAQLAARGLKPASGVRLPYEIPDLSKDGNGNALEALSLWFSAADNVLKEFRTSIRDASPGPVRCWPHHFDIATLVALESGDPEHARSIGVGVSPGDDYYAQPYAYVSPWPKLEARNLPALPPGGHWHTKDFVAGVATAEEILALPEPRAGLLGFLRGAFETARGRLNA